MTPRLASALALATGLGLAAAPPQPSAETTPVGPGRIVANRVEVHPGRGPQGADLGRGRLSVTFLPADWPNITVKADEAWDWSRYGRLLLDLENPGAQAVQFGVRVDDDPAADGTVHCRTAEGTIGPKRSTTVAVDFGPDPMSHGMRGLPGQGGVESLPAKGEGPFDLRHIVSFQVYLHRPKEPTTLILARARLAPSPTLEAIVDRFGQYTRADWPGKVHVEAELARRLEAERQDLQAHPAMPDRDRFGGWTKGPRLAASAGFRTAKVGGKWWLVDPDGRLFVSFGIDEVRIDFPTFVAGREPMFAGLPAEGNPLARFFGEGRDVHAGPVKSGRTFDFYGANLARKYGPGYSAAWKETTLRRLPSWGFNTFGNWSDRFYRNGRVPYVASATILGDHARVTSGSDYWAKMHDPFDPGFAADVARTLDEVARQVKGDPWCLGYFVDNELSWGDAASGGDTGRYGLALGTLAAEAGQPAKAAFLEQLRRKYGEASRLDEAWGTRFATWEALAARWSPEEPFSPDLKADLAEFTRSLARRYFRTVRDRLRQLDPDHLYLGCRFSRHTPEAVQAAAELCDVVSFNIYAPRIEAREWGFLNDLDRPCLIGEYHVGALDRGMFHPGLVEAPSQEARAAVFRDYVASVLDHPALVGCHWFQDVDEPLTGRTFDGENYAIGFVSVTDSPYPEMVAAARAIHRDAYRRRSEGPPRPAARDSKARSDASQKRASSSRPSDAASPASRP